MPGGEFRRNLGQIRQRALGIEPGAEAAWTIAVNGPNAVPEWAKGSVEYQRGERYVVARQADPANENSPAASRSAISG